MDECKSAFLTYTNPTNIPFTVINGSQTVIQAIHKIYPSLKAFFRLRTQHNTDQDTPWVVVYHSLGRLLSYSHAVNILFSARLSYPQLFVDFTVHSFPSSVPRSINLPRFKINADFCLGRMISDDPSGLATYRAHALELENSGFPLNKTITSIASSSSFKPSVHAEVNLHSHLLRLFSATPQLQFFNQTRYIGASKPTCRLCELYFTHHPSGVTVRAGNRNLYHCWAPPAIVTTPGDRKEKQAKERQRLMDRMLPAMRDEVFLILRERCASHTPNDSWDTPSNVPGAGAGGGTVAGSVVMGAQVGSVFGEGEGGWDEELDGRVDYAEVDRDLEDVVLGIEMMEFGRGHGDGEGWRGSQWERAEFGSESAGTVEGGSQSRTPELTEGDTGEEDGDVDDDEGGGAIL